MHGQMQNATLDMQAARATSPTRKPMSPVGNNYPQRLGEGLGVGVVSNVTMSLANQEGGGTSWKVLLAFAGLTVMTPLVLFTSPMVIAGMQIVLGGGLAAATWVIVTYPMEKAKERLGSDRVQPEMHLVLGTLLPELAVILEKLLLWTDLSLRRSSFPVFLRYPVLNFIAYITAPLWFALLMLALAFFILVVTVISFGLVLPLTMPILGLLSGYLLLVPVWVISVYILSMPPFIIATFFGCTHDLYSSICEQRDRARARKMVKQRTAGSTSMRPVDVPGSRQRGRSPAALQQRNPTPGQTWLTKKDLLIMYQQQGLLDISVPIQLPTTSTSRQEALQERHTAEQGISGPDHWAPAAGGNGGRERT